ncbi:hypothetical protein AYO38_02750 [bacterium SCGC AG-212-C10]|nr:hypothetical protein AYO38_02750 [bacterium SCGC AG-212-C10]
MASDRKRTESVPPAKSARETYYDRVYDFVRTIPAGSVVTYGQVALELGAPAASRAVGYALHHLPAESDVPWWRVINAGGRISLKGRGQQADIQRQILEREGVPFNEDGRTELARYRWIPEEQ